MGWFGGSSQKEGIEPGQAPTRAQRKLCWENRDAYFACLDQNGIMQADDGELGDKAGVCKDFRKAYEGACGKSWVSPSLQPRPRGGEVAFPAARTNLLQLHD